jgi:hypothetical protein
MKKMEQVILRNAPRLHRAEARAGKEVVDKPRLRGPALVTKGRPKILPVAKNFQDFFARGTPRLGPCRTYRLRCLSLIRNRCLGTG